MVQDGERRRKELERDGDGERDREKHPEFGDDNRGVHDQSKGPTTGRNRSRKIKNAKEKNQKKSSKGATLPLEFLPSTYRLVHHTRVPHLDPAPVPLDAVPPERAE